MSTPEWTTPVDYHAAARAYQERLGWSAFVSGTTVWMTPGMSAESLNVPVHIGFLVMEQLRTAGIDLPVIHIPGPPHRVALLAQPYARPPSAVIELFAGYDVGYAHGGRHHGWASDWGIDLPPTQHPGHARLSWIRPPTVPLPPLGVIADAVLAVFGLPPGRWST